ncbi:MAG: hypothetical protein ACLU9Q_05365, partial [Marvinbryantia sp.]|uniref:hypothetical protein n=1 Tax=Marvinbryantia sp. TaxID=2496532 RepID=UPI003999CFCD
MRMKMKQKWKRVLVSIMTIAMLASQMTAGVWATGTEHEAGEACWDYQHSFTYESNGNATHNVICPEGHVVDTTKCVYVNRVCPSCHTECNHMGNNWEYRNNGDGTHATICADCDTVVTEATGCLYTDGKCICGAVEESCSHMGNNWEYRNNGDGTHATICADC